MKKETRIMTIATSVIIIFIGVILSALPNVYYKKAEEMFSIGKYEEARDIYITLGDYKDARMQANTVSLTIADNYLEAECFYNAALILSIDDKDDSMVKMRDICIAYANAQYYFNTMKYDEALQELDWVLDTTDDEKEVARSNKMKQKILEEMKNNG